MIVNKLKKELKQPLKIRCSHCGKENTNLVFYKKIGYDSIVQKPTLIENFSFQCKNVIKLIKIERIIRRK